jgi:hypothetical protein
MAATALTGNRHAYRHRFFLSFPFADRRRMYPVSPPAKASFSRIDFPGLCPDLDQPPSCHGLGADADWRVTDRKER